jgi:crotonobetainyl-CoA:carnitine CoA-transferase CaiB-like acyl-CoA transferase
VLRLDEVFADAQSQHLGLRREIDHPRVGTLYQTGFPYSLSDTPAEIRMPPPLLGEHTDEVLRELGCSDDEIDDLHGSGVI